MQIEIPVNRKRFPRGLLIMASICVWGFFIFLRANQKVSTVPLVYVYTAQIIISLWPLYLTSFFVAAYWKTLFGPKTVLTITDRGILHNVGIFNCGSINWSEVTDVTISKALFRNVLIISVKDPMSIKDKQSKLKQNAFKALIKRWGSPVVINEDEIDYNLEELRSLLLKTGFPKSYS